MSLDEQKYSTYTDTTHLVRKTRQIVMLYEGAIRFLQHAKQAIDTNDIQQRYTNLTNACDVINGLQRCLDFNNGGDIAQTLYDYYAGIDSRIMSVHFSNDTEMLELCIEHLRMMKNIWDQIDLDQHSNESLESDISKAMEQTAHTTKADAPSDFAALSLNC